MANRRSNTQVEDVEEGTLSYELKHKPWKSRLEELGSRWVANTPENAAAFLAQIDEAWGLAYICIWNMHGKNGQHANYTDDERNDAAIHMKTALMGYDPTKQSLLKFVEQKSILLLKGAWARGIDVEYDAPNDPEDLRQWEQELAEFQQCADGSPEWITSVGEILYSRFAARLNTKFHKADQRKEAVAQLQDKLRTYDPRQLSLKDFADRWLTEVLGGDKKAPETKGVLGISIDAPIGEDGETTRGEMLSSAETSQEAQSLKKLTAWDILTAAATMLNFQKMLDPNILFSSEDHRHQRMCFTEKVLFLVKHSILPQSGVQDVMRAMLESYLEHFAVMPEKGSAVNLKTLPFKTLEQIEDPDSSPKTWKTPLHWSGGNDFLPARVPISYLKRHFSVAADDNDVNKFRRGFYKALKKISADSYSAEDIKEILSLS